MNEEESSLNNEEPDRLSDEPAEPIDDSSVEPFNPYVELGENLSDLNPEDDPLNAVLAESSSTVKNSKNNSSKYLVIIIAILGVFLLVGSLVLPKKQSDTQQVAPSTQPSPSVSSLPSVSGSPQPTETGSPTGTPSPSDSSTLNSNVSSDPIQAVNIALGNYQDTLKTKQGVQETLVTSDGQQVVMSLAPSGDYRAVTNISTAPEWMFINGKMYAKLGDKELAAQKDGLAAIGKPNAKWTDAAVGTDKETKLLAAGNLANAVADLVPLMTGMRVYPGANGSTFVEGFIDVTTLSESDALIAETYGLSAEATTQVSPSASSGTPTAQVAFTIDVNGALTGYEIRPPFSAQPVSLLVTSFTPVDLQAPPADIVVTLEDLAKAAAPAPIASPTTVVPSVPAEGTDPAASASPPAQ